MVNMVLYVIITGFLSQLVTFSLYLHLIFKSLQHNCAKNI